MGSGMSADCTAVVIWWP